MAAIKLFLVNIEAAAGDALLRGAAQLLQDYLKQIDSSASTVIGGAANAVGATDLVCYLLPAADKSIVKAEYPSMQLGQSGSTIWSNKTSSVISEVYLAPADGDGARERLLANLIYHELMHNKIDAQDDGKDVHAIEGGSLSKVPVNASMSPSARTWPP